MGLDSFEDLIGKSDFDLLRKDIAEKTYKDEQEIMNSKKGLINYEEHEKLSDG